MNRVLIVGGDGQLGRALQAAATQARFDVAATTRRRSASPDQPFLDLADPEEREAFTIPPETKRVYLLAAVTSLRACRQDPVTTAHINVEAVSHLAARSAAAGATPVLVSTNLVFDGAAPRIEPQTPRQPQTAYGQQKAQAEAAVLACFGAVLRPTKILPPKPPMFVDWAERLQANQPIQAFTDLHFAPVPMAAVTERLLRIHPGITQVSATHDLTYFQAAQHLARRLRVPLDLVQPTSAQAHGIPPQERPTHTTLAAPDAHDPLTVIDAAMGFPSASGDTRNSN